MILAYIYYEVAETGCTYVESPEPKLFDLLGVSALMICANNLANGVIIMMYQKSIVFLDQDGYRINRKSSRCYQSINLPETSSQNLS